MKVVIDTNVLLVSLGRKSDYRKIFESILNEDLIICVTTEILLEYEEIISDHLGSKIASNVLQLLENAPNVFWVTNYYKWNLIKIDPDDNKFIDCAIAIEAKYLVSEDKHFNILETIPFPKVEIIKADKLIEIIQ